MSPYEEQDDDEEVVPNTARDNQVSTSMECFSEDSSSASNPVAAGFTAAATSSGGRGALNPRGPGGSEGLDLNSQPPDLDYGTAFGQLLRSSSVGILLHLIGFVSIPTC
jgi:hypothetical protein